METSNKGLDLSFDFNLENNGETASLGSFLQPTNDADLQAIEQARVEKENKNPLKSEIDTSIDALGGSDSSGKDEAPIPFNLGNKVIPNKEKPEIAIDVDPVVPKEGAEDAEDADNEPVVIDNPVFGEILSDVYGIDVIEVDGVDVPVNEVNLSKEDFQELVNSQRDSTRDELLKNKISTDDIPDIAQRVMEIAKNGGDVNAAIETYAEYQSPLEGLDIENSVKDQATALSIYHKIQGMEDDTSLRLIESYRKDNILNRKATTATEAVTEAVDKHIESISNQATQKKLSEEKAMVSYRTELETSLDSYSLNKAAKSKYLDAATKRGESGNFEIDDLYNEVRNDPKKVADILMFLSDEEGFLKSKFENFDRDTKLGLLKRVSLSRKGSSASVGENIKVNKKPSITPAKKEEIKKKMGIFSNSIAK